MANGIHGDGRLLMFSRCGMNSSVSRWNEYISICSPGLESKASSTTTTYSHSFPTPHSFISFSGFLSHYFPYFPSYLHFTCSNWNLLHFFTFFPLYSSCTQQKVSSGSQACLHPFHLPLLVLVPLLLATLLSTGVKVPTKAHSRHTAQVRLFPYLCR